MGLAGAPDARVSPATARETGNNDNNNDNDSDFNPVVPLSLAIVLFFASLVEAFLSSVHRFLRSSGVGSKAKDYLQVRSSRDPQLAPAHPSITPTRSTCATLRLASTSKRSASTTRFGSRATAGIIRTVASVGSTHTAAAAGRRVRA